MLANEVQGEHPGPDTAAVRRLLLRPSPFPPSLGEVVDALLDERRRLRYAQELAEQQARLDAEEANAVSWEQHLAALPPAERDRAEATLGKLLAGRRLLPPVDGGDTGSGG